MSENTVRNAVPTPEQMGELLGISAERVSAIRSIMESPVSPKATRLLSDDWSTRRPPPQNAAKRKKKAKKKAKKATKR